MNLFVKREDRQNLLNRTLGIAGGAGAFKLPLVTKNKLPLQATAVVHELKEGDGHWGRDANKYKVKSKVIGMQIVSDAGDEIKIKNLTQQISIRFINVTSAMTGDCGWWNVEVGEWSVDGCTRSVNPPKDNLGAECKCNHLTEFAIVQQVAATTNTTSTEESSSDSNAGLWVGVSLVAVFAIYVACSQKH